MEQLALLLNSKYIRNFIVFFVASVCFKQCCTVNCITTANGSKENT